MDDDSIIVYAHVLKWTEASKKSSRKIKVEMKITGLESHLAMTSITMTYFLHLAIVSITTTTFCYLVVVDVTNINWKMY